MRLISFNQFILESSSLEKDFLNNLVKTLVQKIKEFGDATSEAYSKPTVMEFNQPIAFDLHLFLRKTGNPDLDLDPHFKSLDWQEMQFEKKGFAIDANAFASQNPDLHPRIEVHLLINPKKSKNLASLLYPNLLDILTHEISHLKQIGMNFSPDSSFPSDPKKRKFSKNDYRYFLLGDEVEAMVQGMKSSAIKQGKTLDQVFIEYLTPFLKDKFITKSQFDKIITNWTKAAITQDPSIKFSKSVDSIINSI